MRLTHTTVAIALQLMSNPDKEHWGYELVQDSGVGPGAVYPILQRFVNQGLLVDTWEDEAKATADGRPPRRFYSLTEAGMVELGAVLDRAANARRFTTPTVQWVGGT